jgi:hypothetical protein
MTINKRVIPSTGSGQALSEAKDRKKHKIFFGTIFMIEY